MSPDPAKRAEPDDSDESQAPSEMPATSVGITRSE
jgi:hypothetical protein